MHNLIGVEVGTSEGSNLYLVLGVTVSTVLIIAMCLSVLVAVLFKKGFVSSSLLDSIFGLALICSRMFPVFVMLLTLDSTS